MRTWKKNAKKTTTIIAADRTPENESRHEWITKRLKECAANVLEAAELLAEEYHSRLYCLTHKNWESYVRETFACSRRWADEMVAANDAKQLLAANCNTLEPASKKLPILTGVRALAVIGRAAQRGGNWRAIVDKARREAVGVVTEQDLQGAKLELDKAAKREAVLAAGDAKSNLEPKLRRALAAREELFVHLRSIRAGLKRLDDFLASEYGRHYTGSGQATDQIRTLLDGFKRAAPYADCPHCIGRTCTHCQGDGWLTKLAFDGLPPDVQARSTTHAPEETDL